MASVVTIKIEGLQQLGERMRKLSSDVALKTSRAATNAAAQVIKKKAKANITASPSVRTGRLRDAVIVKKVPKSQEQYTSEHLVTVRGRGKKGTKAATNSAPYAHFLEWGTIKMPAEPFLRPAMDSGKDEALKAMADKLRQRIEKAGA